MRTLNVSRETRTPTGGVSTVLSRDRRALDPTHGFAHFGDFATSVRWAYTPGGHMKDERLEIGASAPTTYGAEGPGQDGGFAVPPQYAGEIWTQSLAEGSLIPLTDYTPISSNVISFPTDEGTPWGVDGIRAYWQTESTAATQTKPKMRETTLRANKLIALVPMSEDLADDALAQSAYLPTRAAISMAWKTTDAVLWGPGNGQPLGALNSNAAVVQAKDLSQASLTVSITNLTKMISRLPQGSFNRAVWIMNPDAFAAAIANNAPAFQLLPPDPDFPVNAVGKLIGVHLIISQHAKAFSSQGDINLVDLSWYRTIMRSLQPQAAWSMHLYWDAFAAAFRLTWRVDGAPKIVNPLAPNVGAASLSPFVSLAAR